ncbi:hypothetical protein [Micromonospora sp. U21]|uniref:hypothetical protein n=1 Tax=Micromonospora sp. U21 TaxID=2824899 RepID=UPI001B36E356|nr:hypothetical protein [Micromonospora sp. U21]MBQ0901303.1 hypothetical protein [Micromonospora sp. U21]
MASDDVREAQTVGSAMHGAIALLGATVADQEGDQLRQWTDVYGNNLLDFGTSVLAERIFTEQPYYRRARRLVGEGGQEVLVELVVNTVEETASAIGAAAGTLVTTLTNANNRVSFHLLELLAEATGKPKRELVAELEAWASERYV